MPEPLPRRHSGLWLPALGERVLDRQPWRPWLPEGTRLRVWQTWDGGFFAVVTAPARRPGIGALAVTGDAWRCLAEKYGDPFGMAELWPGDEVQLVLPPCEDQVAGRVQVYPLRPGHSLAPVLGTWWAVNGDEILRS